MEVARGKSCDVRHDDLVAKIELIMSETEIGNEIRKKASEVKEMIDKSMKDEKGLKGSSSKAMDDFLEMQC